MTKPTPPSTPRDERVTIVLPTYNRRHVLERSLPCYRRLARRHRLLVLDDASDDGTAGWLCSQGIDVVRIARRIPTPAVRNLGLRLATTRWVFFGEDDVLLPADHVDRLVAEARRLPRCGAVAGRLCGGTGFELPEREPPPRSGRLFDPGTCTGDFGVALPEAQPVPSLHACALVDRVVALAGGGYPEDYPDSAFREESDFYARLWRSGYACWLTPAAWAIHVGHRLGGGARGRRGVLGKAANRWSYWRNNGRFLDRHWRLWRRFLGVPPPGRLKARWAGVIFRQGIAAARRPAAP